MPSSDITDPLLEENYYVIMPIAQSMKVDENKTGNATVIQLLTTSDTSYSKVTGYNSSSDFLDDTYNSYSSGANLDLGMNALSSMIGENVDYTVTSRKKKNERIWYYGEEELEIDDFQSALEALTAEDTDSFTDETPAEKEEISLTIHLDNEDYPTVKIQLYRYNGDSCLAVVDGKSVCLVERELVIDFIETVNEIVLN